VISKVQCGSDIHPEVIRQRLQEYQAPSAMLPPGRSFRAAAVLVPLVCIDDRWSLLFTRRTDTVPSHKGQVAFPGGAVEPGDHDREDTALREASEEIGVERAAIDVLGNLWDFPTITGFLITPVVGVLAWPTLLRLEPGEVGRAFSVPLEWLADPHHFEEVELTLPDGRVDRVVYFQAFDGEKIWGATARITLNFLKVIGWYPK
jgi:8-oxo-dGTP pyrophosphatase MutT (NUDIX family)